RRRPSCASVPTPSPRLATGATGCTPRSAPQPRAESPPVTREASSGDTSAAPVMDYTFHSGDLALSAHLAEPTVDTNDAPGLVLCHGFPTRGRESPQSGKSYPELAERIAAELGWVVLTMNFRGCG